MDSLVEAGFSRYELNYAVSDKAEVPAVLKEYYQNNKEMFEENFKELDDAWDKRYGKDEFAPQVEEPEQEEAFAQ